MARRICKQHPNLLKLDHYGPECTSIIHSLEGSLKWLDCYAENGMSLCDVYMYGLRAAAKAKKE
jgi:hypothetical protein